VIVGNFQESEQLQDGHLLARLTLPARDLQLDWRRFSLVANYLAEYSAYHFEQKDRAENLISSVFYELIERLASSSRREARLEIRFSAFAGWLLFELHSSFPCRGAPPCASCSWSCREATRRILPRLLAADLEPRPTAGSWGWPWPPTTTSQAVRTADAGTGRWCCEPWSGSRRCRG
jgi:hypothetical protein